MRILLINVPHPSIGSRIPDDHLPPLGLLAIGGSLIDAGHDVKLIDAEFGPVPLPELVAAICGEKPEAVLFGHSGSTSGHPVIAEVARGVSRVLPNVHIIYGGVYPTYHWREILAEEPYVTAIVRGEGEETVRHLAAALETGARLDLISGIAFRGSQGPQATRPAPVIRDLDAYRIGWELIDFRRYSYWGGLRAVVVQFSRGCPHLCNYCGQRGFWTRWRHRDPVAFAKELAWLHRQHGVKVVNFADENPTVSKKAWQIFLETLIAENVDLILVGSTRADDIVRDADILHLYKKAGWQRFLLGLENTDQATLDLIQKGARAETDREAIRLMRRHGILSMATWVVGFEEETDRDHWRGMKRLLSYDPGSDPNALRHPASMDAVFPAGAQPAGDPGGPAALGLQAPGARHAPHAALARAAVVQIHRDGAARAAEGALPDIFAVRPRAAPRDALVFADGAPCLAL